ncbi:ABC transporter permease [Cryobacterium tepidiphilum]|uniref:Autoinducer 2 import system permease protein LsrD n=1 Tax=Cryobacterium tepidiphilum TaxID=2486026 RepID=A0A3M8L9N0_9MICO|nr:ABC transporter permease [Cryobacterium tepidiphilum]RNE62207.1 ABC transporter permease [Cryobacterium tepidiphilum]
MTTSISRYNTAPLPMRVRVLRSFATPGGAIYLLLAALLIALILYNPGLAAPDQLMRFIGRTAPVAIVAAGQYFVIVSGELDLSMAAVIAAQVVLAGNLIGQNAARILPVVLLMIGLGAAVGLVNGVITTLLKVPSFIATLGTSLAISGLTFYATGGAPSGNPVNSFRAIGRDGFENVPILGFLPYSVVVLMALVVLAAWLMRKPFGRTLIAAGDNPVATSLSGASVWWLRTRAFILSSLASTVAAVLLVGYAGVSPVVGDGYDFAAITAVVLGGVALSGGRGWLMSAVAAAFALEVLFSLLSFVGVASTWRPAVQGAIILVALGAPLIRWRRRAFSASPGIPVASPAPSPGEEVSA